MKMPALIASLALTLSMPAQAQETLILPLQASCSESEYVHNMLKNEYNEVPFAEADGIVYSQRLEEFIPGKMLIFLNPEKFSYTVAVEFIEDGMTCILVNGNNFSPSSSKISI